MPDFLVSYKISTKNDNSSPWTLYAQLFLVDLLIQLDLLGNGNGWIIAPEPTYSA